MRFILYSMIVDAIANLPAYGLRSSGLIVESTVFSTCAPMLGRMRGPMLGHLVGAALSPACARSHVPAGLYPLAAVGCIVAAGPAVVLFADQLWGRVGSRGLARARVGPWGRCFLTPPKFQGRNPTIPTDPRLDSGWATGRATAARSIAASAISTPIAGNRCRQTVTFAANRVRGRNTAPASSPRPRRLWCWRGWRARRVLGVNCRALGRIQIGAARNRCSALAKVFFCS